MQVKNGLQSPGDLFLTLRLKVKKTLFRFDLKTPAENFIDITSKVMDAVKESCILNGICVIYCPHTTVSYTHLIAEIHINHSAFTIKQLRPRRSSL